MVRIPRIEEDIWLIKFDSTQIAETNSLPKAYSLVLCNFYTA